MNMTPDSGLPTRRAGEVAPPSRAWHSYVNLLLEHSREHTICAVDVDASVLFRDAEGAVPAWLGLEYMAQCMAAHAGLEAAAGRRRTRALLLGSRRLRLAVDGFSAGTSLVVSARHHRGEAGLVAFDCGIHDAAGGPALVEGRGNV